MIRHIQRYLSHHWQICVLVCITGMLFFIPILLWGKLYMVGGDDSKLYYLFPKEYLTNYAFNIISNNTTGNTTGYWSVSYGAPIVALLYIAKLLVQQINTQMLAYGIILAGGFLFFYLFTQQLLPKKTVFSFWAGVSSSLFYIFSPYLIKTLYETQLIPIFLIAVVPATLYFFTLGITKRKVAYVMISAIIYSIFSATVYSLPWFLPVLITLLPYVIYLAWMGRKWFWRSAAVFVATTLLFNFYWIIHFIIPLFVKTGDHNLTSTLSSASLKSENDDVIFSLTYLNNPIKQLVNYLRTDWQHRTGLTIRDSIGAVYLIVIISAGVWVDRIHRHWRAIYLIATASLLLSMTFVTPNFGVWNLKLFQLLNDHMPLFSMFRNMYDKFALAMAFNFAFALFTSLVIIGEWAKMKTYRYVIVSIVSAVTLISAISFIRPTYMDQDYSGRITNSFNKDFVALTDYLKRHQTTSRYLWLPMTFPDYVYITDGVYPNHYYLGISPLQYLAKSSDVAGFYGLATPADPENDWKILGLLKDRKYEDVGHIFASENVGYVIVNHEKIPDARYALLDGFQFMDYQSDAYEKILLGQKIKDFGSRYSLYRVNDKFSVPTSFLTSRVGNIPVVDKAPEFRKEPNGDYLITIRSLRDPTYLVLLEPFNRLWEVTTSSGKPLTLTHQMAYGYGNAWYLDTKLLGQSENIHLLVRFTPRLYILPAIYVSIVSFLSAIIFAVISIWKK